MSLHLGGGMDMLPAAWDRGTPYVGEGTPVGHAVGSVGRLGVMPAF